MQNSNVPNSHYQSQWPITSNSNHTRNFNTPPIPILAEEFVNMNDIENDHPDQQQQ
jgi:hypothetical protein